MFGRYQDQVSHRQAKLDSDFEKSIIECLLSSQPVLRRPHICRLTPNANTSHILFQSKPCR